MPTTTITIYEVSNSYVTNGSNTSISGVFQLTITDGDLTLQSSEGSDSGSSQVMTMDGSAVQRYRFYYDDTISINGGTETVKTFQLRINGVMRSFIMNDSGPTIPSATVGTTFNLLGYTNYTNVNYSQLLCFVRGTRILTSKGNRPVENLRIGDLVETKDHGMQPIRWAGKASLSIRDLIAQPHLRPVLIPASSFARNVPARDLYVSPQHRVMLSGWQVELNFGTDEVIAPAASMVGKNGIRIDVDRR
ncbi:MAG: Hint domain-containing protein [Rhodobacter sp.]|nr:Hint domain-containing protein [Rhodobacter sp.]